jgi:phosphatidylinositol glycan class B
MPKLNLQKNYQPINMTTYLEKNLWVSVLIIYLLTALFSVGFYHFDEHFQIIEFAGYKLGFNTEDYLPWEYHDKIRAAIQPFIVYLISKLFLFFNCYNPFRIAFVLRLLSALLAAYSTSIFVDTFKHQIISLKNRKIFAILSFLLWFAVFHKVRFSSENWSACIFVISLSLFFKPSIKSYSNLVFIGFLLGLSFIIKFQIGFCIFGFVSWLLFIQKTKIKEIVFIIIGILIAVVVGFIIDYWFYNQPVFTPWNYLQQVLFAKYRGSFDSEPWWYFFSETFNRAIPPFSIFIIGSFFALFILKPKSVFSFFRTGK